MFLLTVALGASCWLFVNDGRELLGRIAAQQATEMSRTLALASETSLDRQDAGELDRIGRDLTKNRGIVLVAFHSAQGKLLSIACQDPDIACAGSAYLPNPRETTLQLNAQDCWRPSLGRYAQLTTPVLTTAQIHPIESEDDPPTGRLASRVAGYLTVGIAQRDTEWRVRNIQLTVVLIGAVAVLVSLPVMYGLVHRVFLPIRQLVMATEKIAAGDLETQVAIDRSDVIGTLARSFNEMVKRVRRQKDDLAQANARLATANEQLAAANQGLEQKVRQRTEQLEAAARKLEVANERLSSEIAEKEDFLRTVSHDLNAPLRNIAGMASMLLMKHRASFDPDVIHRLERIQKNVEVETDLIGELLELSRIKSRRQRMETVDVAAIVGELEEMFAQDLESRQIRLLVDTPLPALVCERARLRQLLQNLVDNAIKYMGDGSIAQESGSAGVRLKEVHVGCALRPDEMEFYVRDTGIGIEPDDMDKVFRVFRRGKSEAVQSVAGKGVGLASVKSIVQMYGGTIRVESRVGQGSAFLFTFDAKYLAQTAAVDGAVEGGPGTGRRDGAGQGVSRAA
jgi:signal transduction histidine kinase